MINIKKQEKFIELSGDSVTNYVVLAPVDQSSSQLLDEITCLLDTTCAEYSLHGVKTYCNYESKLFPVAVKNNNIVTLTNSENSQSVCLCVIEGSFDQLNSIINYLKFDSLFDDDLYYPLMCGDILPVGALWHNVHASLLDAFVNCCKIKSAYVLNINNFECESPSKLSDYGEDVMILAMIHGGIYPIWIFFWYNASDKDDCAIGRFATEYCDDIVLKLFYEFVVSSIDGLKNHDGAALPKQIPIDNNKKWSVWW